MPKSATPETPHSRNKHLELSPEEKDALLQMFLQLYVDGKKLESMTIFLYKDKNLRAELVNAIIADCFKIESALQTMSQTKKKEITARLHREVFDPATTFQERSRQTYSLFLIWKISSLFMGSELARQAVEKVLNGLIQESQKHIAQTDTLVQLSSMQQSLQRVRESIAENFDTFSDLRHKHLDQQVATLGHDPYWFNEQAKTIASRSST